MNIVCILFQTLVITQFCFKLQMKPHLNFEVNVFLGWSFIFIITCIQKEHLEVSHERESVEERTRMIRAKYSDGRPMTGRDRRTLAHLQGEEQVLIRRERHLQAANLSWLNKCLKCCRPFEVVFGVLFLLLGLLIIVSLFLTW